MKRGKRREKIGVVVSNKMQKTVIVECETTYIHPFYRKVLRGFKRFKAHDEEGKVQVGDRVLIAEIRPISKEKAHRVVEVLGKARIKMRELPKKAEKEEQAFDTGREQTASSGQ